MTKMTMRQFLLQYPSAWELIERYIPLEDFKADLSKFHPQAKDELNSLIWLIGCNLEVKGVAAHYQIPRETAEKDIRLAMKYLELASK